MDKITELLGGSMEGVEIEDIAGLLPTSSPIVTIATILVCLFMAFFAYKVFRILLVLGAAGGGFIAGSTVIAPLLQDTIEFEYLGIVCGVIIAIIAALLAWKIFKLGVFLSGAVSGYMFGTPLALLIVSKLESIEMDPETLMLIVQVAVAVVIGLLFLLLFKPLFIISTSFGCSMAAAMLAVITWLPNLLIVGAIVGLVLAIVSMINQFKMNKGK